MSDEPTKYVLKEQLLKLIEDHNDLLLFTASSCADYFREYEARRVLDWAADQTEDGNSINTDFAGEILDLIQTKENQND